MGSKLRSYSTVLNRNPSPIVPENLPPPLFAKEGFLHPSGKGEGGIDSFWSEHFNCVRAYSWAVRAPPDKCMCVCDKIHNSLCTYFAI